MNVMGRKDLFNLLLCLLPIVGLTAGAQSPESYHRFLTPQVASESYRLRSISRL